MTVSSGSAKTQLKEANIIAKRYIILSASSEEQANELLKWWNDSDISKNGDKHSQ